MHKSKAEWCDCTFNPITGCLNRCDDCKGRNMSVRFSGNIIQNKEMGAFRKENGGYVLEHKFEDISGRQWNYPFGYEPTFHKYRLQTLENRKTGSNVLVGTTGDIFGKWIADAWIHLVLDACRKTKRHNYLFMTRNPDRYQSLFAKGLLPEEKHFWYGSFVTCNSDPLPELPDHVNQYLNLETMSEKIEVSRWRKSPPNWILMGGEEGSRKRINIPDKSWIDTIVQFADSRGIPVFMGSGLKDVVGRERLRKELPECLNRQQLSDRMKARLEENCCRCGLHQKKNQMISLSAGCKRGEQPKRFAFMCRNCFQEFCMEIGKKVTR